MTQRTLLPILLVGLPIGLALSVVIALYLYYNPLNFPGSRGTRSDQAASLLRRSPNENDLRDYRRVLTTDLALRPPADANRQLTAAKWIASTLGPSNLGLPIEWVAVDSGSAGSTAPLNTMAAVLVEIPGTRHKEEVIVVLTGSHAEIESLDSAVATSTLMSVAEAFAGTPQRRTLVFAFLPGESTGPQGKSPLDALVQSLQLRSLTVRGLIDVRVGAPVETDGPPRARALAGSPREGSSWMAEVREAYAPRKPEGLTLEFVAPADVPTAAGSLAGWRDAPAPYVLLHLSPATLNDEAAPLALARSLEGVLQALANQ